MKFADLRKELAEEAGVPGIDPTIIPPAGVELDDFCATGGFTKDHESDDDDDSQLEQDLQNAVYLLQRASTYLRFIEENCKYHKFLTQKSTLTLQNTIEEISDFLGDF